MAEAKESSPKNVTGYIVVMNEENNQYLGKQMMGPERNEIDAYGFAELLVANDYADPTQARVLDPDVVYAVAEQVKEGRWKAKPQFLIPAEWSEQGGVKITGEKIEFDKLPPREEENK